MRMAVDGGARHMFLRVTLTSMSISLSITRFTKKKIMVDLRRVVNSIGMDVLSALELDVREQGLIRHSTQRTDCDPDCDSHDTPLLLLQLEPELLRCLHRPVRRNRHTTELDAEHLSGLLKILGRALVVTAA